MRDGHLSFFDLAGGRHLYMRGIRGGCTNTLIPAGGILNAPNYMCHWHLQLCRGRVSWLVTMPEAVDWDTTQSR